MTKPVPRGRCCSARRRQKLNLTTTGFRTANCRGRWNTFKRTERTGRFAETDLRRLIRTIKRAGQDSDVWPVVLLLFAVLVPAVCLLWFMSAAMRNERFAARQKLEVAYRGQLASARARLEKH